MGKSKGAVHVGVKALPRFIERAFTFLQEVVAELKRVAWPSREEVVVLSGMVVFSVLSLAAYILVLDYIFSLFTKALRLFR